MIVPYGARLALSSLALFFLIYIAAGFAAALAARPAIRAAAKANPREGARWMLALRLGPAALAWVVVTAFFVPSFLWMEDAGPERMSAACLAAAALGAMIWLRSAIRVLSAASARRQTVGTPIALVGVRKPRVIVSPEAQEDLSPDELAAALRHEEAHRAAHDNWKRLLLLAVPGATPRAAKLESAWARFAEWAADDAAAAGDPLRAAALASALVRVARMHGPVSERQIATPFAAAGRDLEMRVERLLAPPQPLNAPEWRVAKLAWVALTLAALAYLAALPSLHGVIEELIR